MGKCLQLVTGGNIIINTSTSPDLPSTHIEAATMGYRFLPPSNLLNRNFPTYSLQGTGLRDGMAAQAKPSYSQVTQLSLQGLSSRPIPQFTPSAPETNAPPEFIAEIEKDVRGHRGEPKAGARSLSATTHLDLKTVQRSLEEHGSDLDAALMGTYRLRPTGPLQICGEIMQEDGPMCVDDGYLAGLKVKDIKEGSNGIVVDVQSHGDMKDTTRHATPSATGPNMHSASVPDPRPKGNGIPETCNCREQTRWVLRVRL